MKKLEPLSQISVELIQLERYRSEERHAAIKSQEAKAAHEIALLEWDTATQKLENFPSIIELRKRLRKLKEENERG